MDAFLGTGCPSMTLKPCVNLRTLGYRVTGVQRYLLGLLPYMPSELERLEPPAARYRLEDSGAETWRILQRAAL